MSTAELTQKIEALSADADYSDPQTYADLLGYSEQGGEADQVVVPQGDTATTEVVAAPPAQPVTAPAVAAAPAAAPATTPAAESSTTPVAAAPKVDDEKDVQGVATRDGKRVIPYAVLEGTRQEAQTAKTRAQELEQTVASLNAQLAAAKAGATPPPATAPVVEFTEAELEELAADMPAVAKLAKGYRALQEQLTRAPAPAAAAPAAPAADPQAVLAAVQRDIDNHPLLARWQQKGGSVWADAVALDQQLLRDPEWNVKSQSDRFTELQRRMAEDLGIPLPQEITAPTPAAPAAAAPAAPAAPAVTTALPTLTDLSGGPVISASDPLLGMSAGQMVDKAMTMSVEELQRMAGITY